jgi:methyl-accepting chemotaxis protein
MRQKSANKHLSVQVKINLALLAVFALVMTASLVFSAVREKSLVLSVVEHRTKDAADSYFDSINTMMLTGSMAQREVLRHKVLDRPDVIEARIIRGEPVVKQFGPGNPEEAPADALDKRALGGEPVVQVTSSGDEGRVLTVVNPIRASDNYRGTNCLTCHPVKKNTIMGAVRVSYSLKALDSEVARNVWFAGGIQLGLLVLGVVLMGYTVRRVVIKRINALRSTMDVMEREKNLSHAAVIAADDEIGAMAQAFNRMIARFRDSLQAVAGVTSQLSQTSDRVSSVAEQTLKAVTEQRTETDMVAQSINEMNTTVQEVARNAAQTASASREADDSARNGAQVASEASGGIEDLIREIENAAQGVHKVESDTANIGMVVDVIKDVTTQTNLLALNAAIEAARAGEQGRGFAVVADEVRTLALRTQQSTEEIHSMIEQLQVGVRAAVQTMDGARERAQTGFDHVEKAAENLAAIADEVRNINDMNTQIATAAEEQSAVTEEINRNVTNIADIADETSAGAQQTSQISEELVRLATELERLVGQFRL